MTGAVGRCGTVLTRKEAVMIGCDECGSCEQMIFEGRREVAVLGKACFPTLASPVELSLDQSLKDRDSIFPLK